MTSTSIKWVRSLADVGVADIVLIGNKAATLATLRRAGFTVPDGMVLTTEALAHALTASRLEDWARRTDVETPSLPTDLAEALVAAVQRLGSDRLAVRSSGVDEDLPEASYAGQYETVLNVPATDLAAAVRRCWASAFSQQVQSYRRARGSAGQVGMAVLIQPMVQADAAGVAFSADPVTGDRGAAVVNAVRGLGEGRSPVTPRPTSGWCVVRRPCVEQLPRAPLTPRPRSGSLNSLGGSRLTKEILKTLNGQ